MDLYPAVPIPAAARREAPPLWLWPNLLSLDAPLVALVWQDFLARCSFTPLSLAPRVALGAAVWVIYIADRLLDARGPAPASQTARHRFYREHTPLAVAMLALATVTGLTAAALFLPRAILAGGLVVAALTGGYLAAFPLRGGTRLKQFCAALVFTAGVFVTSRFALLPALAFAGLCFGNMLLVEYWEDREVPFAAGRVFLVALEVFALAFARHSPWFLAIAAACSGLLVIECLGARLSRDARSVLADFVLLAPLLLR